MKKYIKVSPIEELKVCVIKASAKSPFSDYKKSMLGLPQNIFSLAAATPDWVTLQMVDETVGIKVDFHTEADVIVIMFHTPDAIRGYQLADRFRSLGKTVILGGLHVSALPDEALQHADAILLGECEEIWEELLEDYQAGRLGKIYRRESVYDLAKVKPYPRDIIPTSCYDYSWTVLVSRGCPNKCSYCTVHHFFPTFRKRPIADIVEEIRQAPTDFIELKADNLTVDRDYCLELFKAIEPLNIIWMTALEPEFAEDEELVRAAAKSGLRMVLLGIETPSREALAENNKGKLELGKVKEQIDRLHSYDIEVDSAMLFGFDSHHETIFEETLNYALAIDLDITHGVIPIPFPGTELYKKLDHEGRLLTKDWSKYDGSWLVYRHPVMDEMTLYKGVEYYERAFAKRHKKKAFSWHHRWDDSKLPSNTKPIKWKTITAIFLVLGAIIFEVPILFGILYIFWAILDLKTGQAYIIENISKEENPLLFYLIVAIWMVSGVYMVVDEVFHLW